MTRFSVPSTEPVRTIQITQFTGANLNPDQTQLAAGESPDMLNIILDDDGTPDKRTGYEAGFASLGATPIRGMVRYRDWIVFSQGGRLFRWRPSLVPAQIFTGIADTKMRGFVFDDLLYILNGSQFLVYDNATVVPVVPHIPTLTISTPPTGGGTALDDWNLIGTGFRQNFNGNGSATVYQLVQTGLAATTVIAQVNGATITEGSGLTVNRTTGAVTFSVAPSTGINNVQIVAHRVFAGLPDRILRCTNFNIFGGNNDTRVHLFGNPDFPSITRQSGTNNPTYWPENAFNRYGSSDNSIVSKVNQYDTSVVFKEDSIWLETIDFNEVGSPIFPNKPINSSMGCIAADSVQLLDNNPVFLTREGVMMLTSSQVRDERNVQLLSEKINSDLLTRDLQHAISAEFDNMYILVLPGGFAWVYHYRLGAWFPWNNFNFDCMMVWGQDLFLGGKTGVIFRLKRITDQLPYNDAGQPILAHWSTKMYGFDSEAYQKMIRTLHVTLRPGVSTYADVYLRSDRRSLWRYLTKFGSTLFSYKNLDYSTFTYNCRFLPRARARKIKAKRVVYFQLRFENPDNDSNMGLLFLALHFTIQREVRR